MASENSSEGYSRIEMSCTNSIAYKIDENEDQDDSLVTIRRDWDCIGEEDSSDEFKEKSKEPCDDGIACDTSCSLHYYYNSNLFSHV